MLLLCAVVLGLVAVVGFGPTLLGPWIGRDLSLAASERELRRERRAGLASAVLDVLVPTQVLGLLCTIVAAHQIALSLRGAMCAYAVFHGQGESAGVLALACEAMTLVLAAACLGVRSVDRRLPGSELSRPLAGLSTVFVAMLGIDALAVSRLLMGIDLRVHASCCSSGFSAVERAMQTVSHQLGTAFSGSVVLALILAALLGKANARSHRGWSIIAGVISLMSVLWYGWVATHVSAPYVFEAPTHRCVYCLLRYGEGGFVGLLLWASVLATAMSASSWLASAFAASAVDATHKQRTAVASALQLGRLRTAISLAAALVLLFAPVAIYRLKTGQWL